MSAIGIVEYIGDMELSDSSGLTSIAVRIVAGHLDVDTVLQTAGGSSKFRVEKLVVVNAPEGYVEGACLIAVRKLFGAEPPLAEGAYLDVIRATGS